MDVVHKIVHNKICKVLNRDDENGLFLTSHKISFKNGQFGRGQYATESSRGTFVVPADLPTVTEWRMMNREDDSAAGNVQLVNANEVARILNVSTRTLWRMKSANQLPKHVEFGGRNVRWSRDAIVDWINVGCPPRVMNPTSNPQRDCRSSQ